MSYLFGDSSPFPHDYNFIETLRDLTTTCSALLQVDEAMDTLRSAIADANREAQEKGVHLDTLRAAVHQALADLVSSHHSFLAQISREAREGADNQVAASRRRATDERESTFSQLRRDLSAHQESIPRILEGFLRRHELIGTQWGMTWTCRGGAMGTEAHAIAMAPSGIETTFELNLPTSHLWASPVRVADLRAETVVQLPRIGGFFNKETKLREERLDKYYVTEVRLAPERGSFELRRSLKAPSPGFDIVMYAEGLARPSVTGLDDQARPGGEYQPSGSDAEMLESLWSCIAPALRPLIENRVRLVQCSLNEVPVEDLEIPARIAQVMIRSFAPLVQELVARSPVAGELALKREVDDGRRDELFLSVEELLAPLENLGASRRVIFDELGLRTGPQDMFAAVASIAAAPDGASEPAIELGSAELEIEPSNPNEPH